MLSLLIIKYYTTSLFTYTYLLLHVAYAYMLAYDACCVYDLNLCEIAVRLFNFSKEKKNHENSDHRRGNRNHRRW